MHGATTWRFSMLLQAALPPLAQCACWAELKEHHGCVNHVSFSSSGACQQPVLGELGSSPVKTCWQEPCADAEQPALAAVSSVGLVLIPRKQLVRLLQQY